MRVYNTDMKIIDLSQSLSDAMPVYPGDPEVSIKRVLTLAKDGWNMNVISLPAHIATHVNVPIHGVGNGKTLDDYSVDAFCGRSVVFRSLQDIRSGVGVLFENAALPVDVVKKIIEIKPKFIGVQGYFESESELATEKRTLKEGIVSFEGLIHIEKLPKDKEFTFYGLPLMIKGGDGSPIRAIAVID